MYVRRVDIYNFRCFKEAHLELNYPGRLPDDPGPVPHRDNVNLLVGANGSGKSSVFQAVVIGVLAQILSSAGFQAEYLVRREPGDEATSQLNANLAAHIKLVLNIGQLDFPPEEVQIPPEEVRSPLIELLDAAVLRMGDVEDVESIPMIGPRYFRGRVLASENLGYFLVGYGASRRTERPEGYSEGNRRPRYQRVAGLFEDHVGLVPFTYAYLQLRELDRFAEARALLNALLPDEINLTEQTDGQRRPLFERDGVLLPFSALSDGFRAFVGWVWDLLFQMARLQPKEGPGLPLTEVPGVVIVDEIDLFLHPEWQRIVVEQVATTFPKLQFLFASHSPLVAGALEPANIFVVDEQRVEQYQENVYGLTANQVLTSSYFGLHSTRAPGTGTLQTLARQSTASAPLPAATEQADVADLALDPQKRALGTLDENDDE